MGQFVRLIMLISAALAPGVRKTCFTYAVAASNSCKVCLGSCLDKLFDFGARYSLRRKSSEASRASLIIAKGQMSTLPTLWPINSMK